MELSWCDFGELRSVVHRTVKPQCVPFVGLNNEAEASKSCNIHQHTSPWQSGDNLARMPHKLEGSVNDVAVVSSRNIVQAKNEIDAGMVDTDMCAVPGLGSDLRSALVPRTGGKHLKAKSE